LTHKSSQWSWNYWERGSTARPYPDDLDDTACAVAALIRFEPKLVNASAQANIAKSLIACETNPGGPYRTWLVPPENKQWQDIDPVVNANVGHMLAKLDVRSAALERYFDECIESEDLESPYYVGVVPSLYFVSRWYTGRCVDKLKDMIARELSRPRLSALERAMLVTAAYNIGHQAVVTNEHISCLVKRQRGGTWPAAALYYEPPEKGKLRFAGSAELTTAFVIEALTLWQKSQAVVPEQKYTPPEKLKAQYRELLISQNAPEVIDSANIIARAGSWRLNSSSLRHLNRGSRNGWLAYAIYDDFIDGEGYPKQLGIANLATRESIRHFAMAIPDDDFHRFVNKVFELMDSANLWELQHARNPLELPRYGSYARLAHRSWGHVIAPTGALVLAGFPLDGVEIATLHNFFRHYIIAKQLADDAHDWLSDLRRNHITPVVALLLKEQSHNNDVDRQLYFWQHVIDEVNSIIREHLGRARALLDDCYFFTDTSELGAWLNTLEKTCAQAEQGREAALQFIATFTKGNLVK